MPKFRKKPVEIEAERFYKDKQPWPEGVEQVQADPDSFIIRTLEGDMEVSEGDWVITGVANEKYPCKHEIFKATYEFVEEGMRWR